jgi:hypothetical protein
MSEENMPEDIRVQHPEQDEVRDPARMEELAQELAIGHDQQGELLSQQSDQIAKLQERISELEAQLQSQNNQAESQGSKIIDEPIERAEDQVSKIREEIANIDIQLNDPSVDDNRKQELDSRRDELTQHLEFFLRRLQENNADDSEHPADEKASDNEDEPDKENIAGSEGQKDDEEQEELGEGEPGEDEKGPDDKDKPKLEKVEVPPINSGDYPDLYAKMKDLRGGDKERLLKEAERLKGEIEANVRAQVDNFRAENPNATAEQIDQLLVQCAVEAKNKLTEDILDAIDGRGYTDAKGNEKGKSKWRRFGAWMDKHGSKLKKGMLIAGAVVLTGGVMIGAIVPAFALGAGTVVGAVKGAAVGLGMSRHGSKESAAKKVDLAEFRDMTTDEQAKYTAISDYLMSEFNKSADVDHRTNVSKTRRAAIVGAVVGGLFGSLSFSSPDIVSAQPQIEYEQVDLEIPNSPPDIPNFDIEQGQLTGDVIRETLQKMGLNGDRFVNPDGSTNLDLIVDRFFNGNWDAWHDVNALPNGTHSMAGADNISNEGIRKVIESVVAEHDWGSHIETVDIPKVVPGDVASGLESSLWANITKEITGLLLAAGISKEVADRTKLVPGKSLESEESSAEPEEPEAGPETPPAVDGGSQGEDGREPPETTTGINGPIDGGPVVTETSGGPEVAEKETETEIELGGQKFTVGRSYDINSPYEGRDEKVRYRYLGFDERSRQHQFEEEEGGRILYRNNDALRLMVGNRNIAPAS